MNLHTVRLMRTAPGMVMLVFTIDGLDYVYKVIKDKFSAPKTATKQQVKDKYNFVKQADRVGRLVDTHEFRYLAFDLSRFSEELLIQMKKHIGDSLVISGKALILKHVYVERPRAVNLKSLSWFKTTQLKAKLLSVISVRPIVVVSI